jgi:hypothetical protein
MASVTVDRNWPHTGRVSQRRTTTTPKGYADDDDTHHIDRHDCAARRSAGSQSGKDTPPAREGGSFQPV